MNSSEARRIALLRWSREPDREGATLPGREAAAARFEREVDPDGKLRPEVRAKLAAAARRAHMIGMAIESHRARRHGR